MEKSTTKHSRIDVADVLRGLAVAGILLLHCIEHFNFYSFPDTSQQSQWLTFCDRAIWDGMFFLLGGKAYAIFALLFGFSFFIQYDNQMRKGRDFRLRFCWRLILLFLFGNLNASFFTAEVLVLYSLTGFILPLCCKFSDKTNLIIATILLIQPLPLIYTIMAWADPSFITPVLPTGALWQAAYAQQGGGDFFDLLKVNLWEGQLASLAWAWDNGRVFQTAALFLIGYVGGRNRFFSAEKLPMWQRIGWWSLIAFFPLYGIGNMIPDYISNPSVRTPLLLVISSLYKFAFMLLLVSGVMYAFYCTTLKKYMMKLAPYGKMSLTNYIVQSIFGAMIFYNWGFSLHDDLTITGSILTGVVLLIAQIAFCRWWMSKHNHGPLEYIWKRATWLK